MLKLKMKEIVFVLATLFPLNFQPVFAGNGTSLIGQNSTTPFEQKVFIENKGQADDKIKYTANSNGVDILFSKKGVTWKHDKQVPLSEKEMNDLEKKTGEKKEREEKDLSKLVPEYLEMQWLDANPSPLIDAKERVKFYYTYPQHSELNSSTIVAPAFSIITYHDLYPGIDVEYIMPKDKPGIKYSIIVHPGADVSKIRMRYRNAGLVRIDSEGNAVIESLFGTFIDHSPSTFYQNSGQEISSFFSINNNSVSFSLGEYDDSKTIVIDPWTVNPNFPGFNSAYDINYDNAGNVFAYGSYNPLKLAKFDAAGNPLWIYNQTGAYYAYGDFAVDEGTGISYVGDGKTGPTVVHKVNSSGIEIALSGQFTGEIWRMVFDRLNNTIILAGGSGPQYATMMDTTLNGTPVIVGAQDMVFLAIDNCGPNNCYMANCQFNLMWGMPATNLAATFFQVNDGYTFNEVGSVMYVGSPSFPANGFNGMAVSQNFLYTYDGAILKKWDKTNGNFLSQLNINGTPFLQGGLDVDECENIYVGNNNRIDVYDQNFTLLTTYNLSDAIYDLKIGRANELYACGRNFVTEIDLPDPLVVTSSTPVTSCNSCNGTATVTYTFCNTPTYVWMPGGQTTVTATGLCTGTYTVIATTCSHIYKDSVTITGNSSPLVLNATQNDPLCNGGIGTATVTVTGGNSPYTYSWAPGGQSGQTATGLNAGTYTVFVTDNTGCTSQQTYTITQPSSITANAIPSSTTCGNNNGSVTVTASGGTGTLNYSWAPSGGTNANASGLSAGTYTVYITDANGCTFSATANVAASSNPTLTLQSQINVLCNGQSTGSATMNASGGNGPYTYAWTPSGGTNANASGLGANTYTCTVTDVNGCTQTQTVTITQPLLLSVTAVSTQTNCTGSIGTASASASGGTPGYSYSWNNGQTTQTASSLGAGTYTVTVTDLNGCTQSQTVVVTANNPVTLTASSTASGCLTNNGTASASASNGTTPYSYSWSSGQTTQNITGLGAGTYTITVTDANGCSQTQTVNVAQTAGPTANATASATSISPGGNSQLTATGGGTYSWYPSSGLSCTSCANPAATPGQTTTYCVQVTDANGCTDVACVTITVDIPCVMSSLATLLPNAFSPDGNGQNEKYCVPANVCIVSFVLKVYDRWGEKVFESESLNNCWDGIYRGKALNTDVFVYYFDATLSNGEPFSLKGNISLVK